MSATERRAKAVASSSCGRLRWSLPGVGTSLLLALTACGHDMGVSDGTGGVGSGTGGDEGLSLGASGGGGGSGEGSGAQGSGGSGGLKNSTGGSASKEPIPGGVATDQTDVVPQALQEQLQAASALDGAALRAAYPVSSQDLGFVPSQAEGMDLIQASAFSLNADELAKLDQNGFVVSKGQTFPSFAFGYKSIYGEDLPVYVSADSMLEALHRTFDHWLKTTEQLVLIEELSTLLSNMRARIPSAVSDAQTAADVDLYLSVAQAVLDGQFVVPTAQESHSDAEALSDGINQAEGHHNVTLFGVERDVDFSQFKPRGHYTDSEKLERYFRAMMWLGRVDFRMVETQSDGSQVFHRRQFDAAAALRSLIDEADLARWQRMDALIGAFVGEYDSMTLTQLAEMMAALGVGSEQELADLSDDAIVEELASGGWGAQRISSRILIKGATDVETLPLDRSFLLFGQRYTVDSHTFSNTTHDRVAGRLMPKPLDAAFAALGNNAALSLLSDDLQDGSYAGALAKTRTLVDAHEDEYWQSSVYTNWLSALRELSPTEDQDTAGIVPTDGWRRRILSTQLGSWAQLRHDTILYVKQSYTLGLTCEFPDAYVDPYPEFYRKLGDTVTSIRDVVATLPDEHADFIQMVNDWVGLFTTVTASLAEMAENQVSGTPHSQELMDFINDAVNFEEALGCGGPPSYYDLAGWYLKLFPGTMAIEYDPVVADVHTQPTDAGGGDVGRILHVGTGQSRLMVVTAETCMGPRAYAGLAFSYGEHITEDWHRMSDPEWSEYLEENPFPDPEWMTPVLAE